jgi:2-iminoacetate synthase
MIDMHGTEQTTDIKKILAEKQLDGNGQVWQQKLQQMKKNDVQKALATIPGTYSFEKILALISPAAEEFLEQMAQQAKKLTIKRFGKTIRLYAPLYLSNYCENSCLYCGFNKSTAAERIRLTVEQAVGEADIIATEGFTDILLVSSEDREFITVDYLTALAKKLRKKFSSIAVEIYQLSREDYAKLFEAGIEAVTIYQETYNRTAYSHFHPAGPKANYDRRLAAPDLIAQAGMRQIGIGVLLGLNDFRLETLALAEHADFLIKRYWQSQLSFSFPRLRPAQNVTAEQFKNLLSDKNLVQMITALRLCFADVGLVLSTRERAEIRDNLIQLGITKISAGSKTNPAGYSGKTNSLEQFETNDKRSPAQIAQMLKSNGFEPVWKDWDTAFLNV